MDIASRPAVGLASTGRPEAVQYREAVRTELPRAQRVAQPLAGGASSGTGDRRAEDIAARDARILADRGARMQRIADTIQESLQKRIERDEEAGILVYRTVDRQTGEVVRQFPEDMVLKLKAYARQMARKKQDEAETGERLIEKVA